MEFRVSFVKKQLEVRPITTDYDRLEVEEKKILLYLLENEKISRKEAVQLLDVGETKIKQLFNMLIDKNLIERKGKGRGTYYCMINNRGGDE